MPLGSARLTLFAKPTAAAPATSWADWTSSDVGTLDLNAGVDRIDMRATDVCYLNSNFYALGVQSADRTVVRGFKHTISGSTLTYDSDSTFSRLNNADAINRNIALTLPSLDKAIYYVGENNSSCVMHVVNESGGAINELNYQSITYTNITGADVWTNMCVDPNDNSKFCVSDRDGNLSYFSLNNSTNVITLVDDVSSSTLNATATTARMHMVDNSGTTQVCVVYVDATTNEWKIYQSDMDGTNSTTYTLGDNDTLSFSTAPIGRNKFYHTSDTLIYVSTSSANTNVRAWYATWNGSTWTQNTSEQSISVTNFTSNATFQTQIRQEAGISAPDDVHFILCKCEASNGGNMIGVVGGLYVTGGAVTLLDTVQVTNTGDTTTNSQSNSSDQGFIYNDDDSRLCVIGNDLTDGQYFSLSILTKPT